MKINLYLIRHGQTDLNKRKTKIIFDPNINNTGIEQCSELKQFLKNKFKTFKNAKLYTSILARTQETALLSISRKNITVMNHLKEHQNFLQKTNLIKYSNFPYKKIVKQQEHMKEIVGLSSLKRIRYEDDIINEKGEYKNKIFNQEGNIHTFLKENKERFKNGDTIIIFCHGKMIRQFLKRKEKAKNCTCFQVRNDSSYFNMDKLDEKPEFEILFEPVA
jgi:broad specificity phosphatase PhoE